MKFVATLFFDLGGVLLTNGWDAPARQLAAARFELDPTDFQARHDACQRELETGRLSLRDYVRQTVFDRPRDYTPEDFLAFIFDQSQELPGHLDYVRALAATGRYRLCTLNNESRELNDYRIRRFGLDGIFLDFFSSCYLGHLKPEPAIYEIALAVTCGQSHKSLFIDDRPANVAAAGATGMIGLAFRDLAHLRADLAHYGVHSD